MDTPDFFQGPTETSGEEELVKCRQLLYWKLVEKYNSGVTWVIIRRLWVAMTELKPMYVI